MIQFQVLAWDTFEKRLSGDRTVPKQFVKDFSVSGGLWKSPDKYFDQWTQRTGNSAPQKPEARSSFKHMNINLCDFRIKQIQRSTACSPLYIPASPRMELSALPHSGASWAHFTGGEAAHRDGNTRPQSFMTMKIVQSLKLPTANAQYMQKWKLFLEDLQKGTKAKLCQKKTCSNFKMHKMVPTSRSR